MRTEQSEKFHLDNALQSPLWGTQRRMSVLFPDEEIKVQMGDLTSPNHRFLQEQSLFLTLDLLPPSLRKCPFINHKKETVNLRVDF